MGKDTQDKNILTREFSSGGIVYKKTDKGLLWLVRRTSASKMFPNTYWMFPKGWLDDAGPDIPGPMARGSVKATEEILQKTAIRETREETGVEAKIIKKIGTINLFYTHPVRGKVMKFVTHYLMEWVKDGPNGFDFETSEIAWLPYNEALERLSYKSEKEALEKAKNLLITFS